ATAQEVRTTRSSGGALVRAPVMEVFASLQGEGHFAGEPQVFVRLAGCPLRCRWSDTPGSWRVADEPRARVDARRPGESARREEGWATPFQVATWVAAVEPGRPRTVSVTGGEPLLWPEFVRALARLVRPRRVHLETAGAHPRALAAVLERVDHVSLDLKLPADMEPPEAVPGTGAEPAPESEADWAHVRREVLGLVRGRDARGKLILHGARRALDSAPLLDAVPAAAPEPPLYVQPATPVRAVPAPPIDEVEALAELAHERGLRVRVIPQLHRQLGLP